MLILLAMAIRHAYAVVAILLATVIFNAVDRCRAFAPVSHSCCPASEQQVPQQCPKLGCFMSAPILRAKVPSLQPRAALTSVPVALFVYHASSLVMPGIDPAPRVFDRPLSFRQLLI